MSAIKVLADCEITPAILAASFWNMDSEQQADFFSELETLAGIKLCFQMAAVIQEISERAEKGDRSAQHGLQTMLSHAASFAEASTDYRYWAAQRVISQAATAAKAVQP